ncbi:MAG: sigma-70 family RNA polymerase sigma factor [Ignavibacteria bacterium]|nr:sigma-70 family RNA polymerase sigma factor [Ignavibacteria bacterium]
MQQEDQLLIDRLKNGDGTALTFLVGKYRTKAISTALRMVKDKMLAEEVVQDSFSKVYRNIKSFNGESSFSTWFFRIVYTTSLNYLQRQRRMPLIETFSEDETGEFTEPSVFTKLTSEEIETAIQSELKLMSPLYAVVIDLFYVQECTYDEIVAITGMPLGTVKTRLNRGRSILKNALLQQHSELVSEHTDMKLLGSIS